MPIRNGLPRPLKYILIGFLLWVIVDWGTAGGFRWAYFETYGFLLLFFYLGFPILFAFLIYRCGWSQRKLLMAEAAAVFLVEAVCVRNPFVLSFPLLLIGIPLAFCVYAPLVYFPLWILTGEMGKRKYLAGFLTLVVAAITFLSVFGGKSK
ncbi:MAG: hypothetical protein JW929_15050 [Anaerolineales bacterium]|nr:hypothetical protein [Anaerolineales bacterium]